MSDGERRSAIVACVGGSIPADPRGRFRLERIDRAFLVDYAAHADCALLDASADGLAALETLRACQWTVPTVLYDRYADPAIAQRATRLGVTEYVAEADIERLHDRVAAVAGVGSEPATVDARPEPRRDTAGLDALIDATDALEAAETTEEVAEIAAETAAEITGCDAVLVQLLDDEGGIAAAASGALDPPEISLDLDEEAVESALRRDEVVIGDGSGASVPATVTVPVGERAVLAVRCGAPPTGELNRRLLSALADDIDAALSRLDRRRDLRWHRSIHDVAGQSAFVIAPDGRIELATHALADRVDATPDRLAGRSVTELFGVDGFRERYASALDCEDGSVTVETILQGPDEAVPVEVELSAAEPNGESEALLGIVTERRDDDAAFAFRQDSRFRHLFDQLPDAVVDIEFVDGDPLVRRVNEAFEETFGYEESAVVGEPLDDLIVPDGHEPTAERIDEAALDRGHDAAEVERTTVDGPRTFLFRGFSYRSGDQKRGFGIYTDITDRLEQERRLRVLHRVLRHNLRNEITAIAGYAELLTETATTQEELDYASRIYEQVTDVSKLGEQVRRIEQALDVDRKRVDLDPEPLVTDIADRFRSSAPEATIRVSAEETAPVVADELLKIALENLLENAVEHHPDAATVEIELSTAGERWVDVAIRDDGPGIPERERAVVGGDREITQLDHSMGLGLWVSRWIVRGVDGQLLFGDRESGAEVVVRLQRADAPSTSE